MADSNIRLDDINPGVMERPAKTSSPKSRKAAPPAPNAASPKPAAPKAASVKAAPKHAAKTDVRVSAKDAEKAARMAPVRAIEEQMDVSVPYFVMSLVEPNPEVFTSPRGTQMIDKGERKKVNSVILTLRKQQLDASNKWGMVEECEVAYLPFRTDQWALDNGYNTEEVNRALYANRGCYPHRAAFFRMFAADQETIDTSGDFDLIAQIREQNAVTLGTQAAQQSKAGGAYIGSPGMHHAPIEAIPVSPEALVENEAELESLLRSGAIRFETEPA